MNALNAMRLNMFLFPYSFTKTSMEGEWWQSKDRAPLLNGMWETVFPPKHWYPPTALLTPCHDTKHLSTKYQQLSHHFVQHGQWHSPSCTSNKMELTHYSGISCYIKNQEWGEKIIQCLHNLYVYQLCPTVVRM